MSGEADLLLDQVSRFLADAVTRESVRDAEGGVWPQDLWERCAAMGLPLAIIPDHAGGFGLNWADCAGLFALFGRHALPLPLGETMAAAALLAEAGLPVPDGPIALGTVRGGRIEAVAFARWCPHLVIAGEGRVRLYGIGADALVAADGMSREPRDSVDPQRLGLVAEAAIARTSLDAGAVLRACQIAGALAAILEIAVDYANQRRQFGRPIGQFQAVQHSLARLAGEAAAAGAAAAMGAAALDRREALGVAVAKVRCGEAAGIGATIGHQALGAIGFTDDHHLHHLTRRLWTWRDDFGGERHWQDELATLALAGGGDVWSLITQ